jgi:uncharacterized membrane protein YcaP (DUF421 family)
MKKLILFFMFFINFVAVKAVLNIDISTTINNALFQEEISLWFGLLAASIFSLFTIEILKISNKFVDKNKKKNHVIDSYV